MTLKEMYENIGGSYEKTLSRFLNKESLVQKYVMKFSGDSSYSELCNCLDAKDYDEAFRFAHTLKGISQNLGFDSLYESSSLVTEALRAKDIEKAQKLMPELTKTYTNIISAIKDVE